MKKIPQLLSGLLVLQLLLASGIFWLQQPTETAAPMPLLADATSIDKIVIKDGELSATLVKKADQWQLPTLDDLPADAAKIAAALSSLQQQTTRYPIATQANSHSRFAVTEADAERQLQFFEGSTPVADILLGDAAGLRQLHVRRVGEDAVYTVQLNHYDFPGESEQWLDRKLLAADQPQEISSADFTLKKAQDRWQLVSDQATDDSATLDTGKANALATAISQLRVQAPADIAELKNPKTLEVKVEGQAKALRYQLAEQDGRHYVMREDIGKVFELSAYDYGRLRIEGLDDLLTQQTATKADGDASPTLSSKASDTNEIKPQERS